MTVKSRIWLVLTFLALVGLAGCQAHTDKVGTTKTSADDQQAVRSKGGEPMKIELTSTAFKQGERIPKKHTGEGDDVSPPLAWTNLPEGTKELALICDDPDAPSPKAPGPEPWVHWVISKIAADAQGLPEGVARTAQPKQPAGALQGTNSWDRDNVGYRGPMPPPGSGTHRYFFRLYALKAPLDVKPGLDKKGLLAAMAGQILGQGELMGTYSR
jgi:Raf kinase inhibitor-like YbhB/YbcL family protein